MDLTGAHWRLLRVEAILKLRSQHSSGDFADYWHLHRRRSFSQKPPGEVLTNVELNFDELLTPAMTSL